MILMGANDAIRITDNQLRLNFAVNNMRTLIEKAKAKNLSVILAIIQYFVESRGTAAEPLLSRRRDRNVDLINNAYRSMAAKYGLKIADINSTMGNDVSLYSDNVHPNRKGDQVLGLVWFDALNQEIAQNYQSIGVIQNYPNLANSYTKIGFTLSEVYSRYTFPEICSGSR
jgi:acyl-CoA thioesterase-1